MSRFRLARPASRGVVVAGGVIAAIVVAGAVVAATHVSPLHTKTGDSTPTAQSTPGAAPVLRFDGLKHGRVKWDHRLVLRIRNGELNDVEVARADGSALPGRLAGNHTSWTSATTLIPLTAYVARISYTDLDDQQLAKTVRFKAGDTGKHMTAMLSPGDGNVVGVGSPVVVYFTRPVPESKRAVVESRLAVATTPDVVGAWHWMNAQEVHWRPPTYWKPGTTVTVTSDLDQLYFGAGIWGEGAHTTTFRIGDSHISRVDAARHQMYVYDNGHLIKTFPISAGRDKYPTKSGVHITFEKSQVVTMDSATVGIPRNSPDGYYEKVYWDVRISYGGAFVHAAPWSVAQQGVVNVSHGCVNLATDNAIWFYNYSMHGDVVDVYNTGADPDLYDPGMADWNMSWRDWVAGDAAPTGAALAAHPPLPRDVEPAAPPYHPIYTPPPSSPSPSPSPTPSPKPTHSASPSPSPSPTKHHH